MLFQSQNWRKHRSANDLNIDSRAMLGSHISYFICLGEGPIFPFRAFNLVCDGGDNLVSVVSKSENWQYDRMSINKIEQSARTIKHALINFKLQTLAIYQMLLIQTHAYASEFPLLQGPKYKGDERFNNFIHPSNPSIEDNDPALNRVLVPNGHCSIPILNILRD